MKKALALLFVNLVVPLLLIAGDATFNKGYVDNKGFYVSVPFETKNDLLIIQVTIKGRSKKFLLDTGAPTTISQSLQQQYKFDITGSIAGNDINGNTGTFKTVNVNALTIGDLTVKDVPAIVIADDNPVLQYLGVDGIIGSNYLRSMIVRISVRENRIILTDDIALLDLQHAYKEHMHTDKDIQSSPVIKVKLGQSVTEELLFDTGFSGFYDLAAQKFSLFGQQEGINVIGLESNRAMYGLIGLEAPAEKQKILIPQYNVGGFVFHNVIAYTSSDDNSKIGAKFLRTADVTLDYVNNKFYLQPYPMASSSFDEFCCLDTYYCKN